MKPKKPQTLETIMQQQKININNKKAYYKFEIIEKFTAGIALLGTEIKSLRQGKASLSDAYCKFIDTELWVEMNIAEYSYGGHFNHEPNRRRKLLLSKVELKRIERKTKTTGNTIIPLKIFINNSGWAKIVIAIARGKKMYDKREDIKQRDSKRELARERKQRNNS